MHKKSAFVLLLLLVLGLGVNITYAINGADVSTLTTQENFGVVYNECGTATNMLTILKNRGLDIARIRLFVNPDTSQTGTAMDLPYVLNLAQQCKNAGMQVMLDLHYSDTWADVGSQTKPAAWEGLTGQELIDQVYTYTKDVVSQVAPDYVQIGNETTCGMLFPDGEVCDNGNWEYYADLVNAGVWGAEDGGCNNTIVHISPTDGHWTVEWFFDNLTAYTTEFSIIGLSWYPEWHGDYDLQTAVDTAKNYKNNVMLCEIGDYWTGRLKKYKKTEETQYQFVLDCQSVGASAVIYWEAGWLWDSPVGERCLFKPINDNWKNVEMTLALEQGFGGSACGSGGDDTTPPAPDPMTWETVPYATSSSSIAMVATTASDESGVEYYFSCISGGGHDSAWQDSTSYEDTGLSPETTYTYTVKARDKSGNQNQTAESTAESATTDPDGGCTPATVSVDSIACTTVRINPPLEYGQVTVTVTDDCGNLVSGVDVTGTFSGDFNEQQTATTDGSGEAVLTTSTNFKKPSYTFCVDDLTHSTLTYDSNANVETCDSY